MNATTKFYAGFFVAVAIVIAVSYAIGYRVGYAHAASMKVTRSVHGVR